MLNVLRKIVQDVTQQGSFAASVQLLAAEEGCSQGHALPPRPVPCQPATPGQAEAEGEGEAEAGGAVLLCLNGGSGLTLTLASAATLSPAIAPT